MKDIKNYIIEGSKSWEYCDDVRANNSGVSINVPKSAKWLLINPEGEFIGAVTENDLKSWTEDYNDDSVEKACKNLKIGEVYDADGGINIYIRIKK